MGVLGGLFIVIMAGILADTIVKIVKARSGGEVAERLREEVQELTRQVDEQAGALTEAQAALATQEALLLELQERLDFAERVLAQSRDRPGLGRGPV